MESTLKPFKDAIESAEVELVQRNRAQARRKFGFEVRYSTSKCPGLSQAGCRSWKAPLVVLDKKPPLRTRAHRGKPVVQNMI